MQEDKTCQEQEPSVGVGGEGQIEGGGWSGESAV